MIFDAHLDLAMNALEWNRDLRAPLVQIRQLESGLTDKKDRSRNTVCFPEMRRGQISLCVATQIARYVKPDNPLPGWRSPEQAWAQTQGQLAWYKEMERQGELFQISSKAGLREHLDRWTPASDGKTRPAIGFVLSLEGADSLVTMGHLDRAFREGLRAVGPAHYGPGTYAQGTHATGGIGLKGRELLRTMDELGLILDVTHLCDESFWEALDCFSGPVWASHSNCRALVPHERQFTDEQLRILIERGAVIGAVLDAWMMTPDWERGVTTPEGAQLKLERIVDHIDHICQLAGNAKHCGIGSDLDGAFGTEQTPMDVASIADLARLPGLLQARGFNSEAIEGIANHNFVDFLGRHLPES